MGAMRGSLLDPAKNMKETLCARVASLSVQGPSMDMGGIVKATPAASHGPMKDLWEIPRVSEELEGQEVVLIPATCMRASMRVTWEKMEEPTQGDVWKRQAPLKDSLDVRNFLTILTKKGRPCNGQEAVEYMADLPTIIRQTTLHWPLQVNAWQCPEEIRQVVWDFMAWKDTEEPRMAKGFYWAQRIKKNMAVAEKNHDRFYDPRFPFRLIKGWSTLEQDGSEASISEDEEDQEAEADTIEKKRANPPPFLWKNHRAVKITRAQYRMDREATRATRARTTTPTTTARTVKE